MQKVSNPPLLLRESSVTSRRRARRWRRIPRPGDPITARRRRPVHESFPMRSINGEARSREATKKTESELKRPQRLDVAVLLGRSLCITSLSNIDLMERSKVTAVVSERFCGAGERSRSVNPYAEIKLLTGLVRFDFGLWGQTSSSFTTL